MKVLLVNPTPRESITKEGRVIIPLNVTFEPPRFPLSLCLIASAIREAAAKRHASEPLVVRLVDGPVERCSVARFRGIVESFRPQLSILNVASPTLESDLEFARIAHQAGGVTVAYGQHAQALPASLLTPKSPIDLCVIGEPETVCADLAVRLLTRGNVVDVPGTAKREHSGRVKVTPSPPPVQNLDELARPARDLVNPRHYRLPDGERYTLVLTGRGCPFDCAFCLAPRMHGRKARLRSPESLIDEAAAIVHSEGIRSFLFQADLFTANREWTLAVCREIERRNLRLRWICNARIDTLDAELLACMRGAGLFLITFGIESGDPDMLARLGKPNVTPAAIRKTVSICRRLGIKTNGSFVIGHPGETWESLERTRRLILSLPLDMAVLMCATPHPGTPLFDQLASGAGFLTDDFRDYSFNRYVVAGTGLDPAEISQFLRTVRREFYLSPRYAFRRLGDLKEPLRALRSGAFVLRRLLQSRRAFRPPESLSGPRRRCRSVPLNSQHAGGSKAAHVSSSEVGSTPKRHDRP
jgi:radical SAM superfamily enzyme YgiQ (UPF0313 family)